MSYSNPCLVGAIDPTDPDALDNWANCAMPDCHWKVCTWAGTVYCGVHSEELLGEAEVIRRYDATHVDTWAECQRRIAEEEGEA